MVSLTRLLSRTTSGGGSGTGTIILNKYQLGSVLGRGSFAKVYQAKHLDDAAAETVAVKAIDKSLLLTAPLEELLIREVAAMRRLGHHPGILKIHEVLATKTKIYLVMELAAGGELFTRLQKRGRFSESTARVYFLQLISALSFCHQQGIAHRDIKPQNLLLDVNGNLKISDFGLSALPEQLKDGLLQTSCGTPAYTAPEVLNRRAYDGIKADSWSCGVLLYVFLVGSLPFDDSDIPGMRRAMARRAIAFPNWVSKSARSVISKLLDPNPKTRLTIEALMNCNWLKRAKGITKLNEMGFSDLFGDENSAYNQTKINAFDIISMSPGLNLTGLFEAGITRKELRFVTENKVAEIEAKVETVGTEVGFKVERGKGGGMGLVKGSSLLRVEMSEIVDGLRMVELKVVEGRRLTEFEASHWMQLKIGLKDIAISWHEEVLESVVSVE